MILVFGEALIDLVPAGPGTPADARVATGATWRAAYGGGPANTAVALARLGTHAAFAGRLSGDTFGRQLRAYLDGCGVDLSQAVPAAEPTTLAVVALDQHGSAEYQFYVNGTADWQWSPAELPAQLPAGTAGLHIGSLATIMSPGATVLRDWITAIGGRTVVTYDVNVRTALLPDRAAYNRQVDAWLAVSHIVKASHDDLAWLYPDREPLDVAAEWAGRHDVALVLVTLGPYGAVAVPRGQDPVRVPGHTVDVIDTVGAGDTFTAAYLHWLNARDQLHRDRLDGVDHGTVLRFATAAAALACTREGAQPPTLPEVESFLAAAAHCTRPGAAGVEPAAPG